MSQRCEAETAATNEDQRSVYPVVRKPAPRKPRQGVMIKDANGKLLTKQQEHGDGARTGPWVWRHFLVSARRRRVQNSSGTRVLYGSCTFAGTENTRSLQTFRENAFSRGVCSNFEWLLVGGFRKFKLQDLLCLIMALSPQRGCVLLCKHFVFSDAFFPGEGFWQGMA